MIVRRLLGVMTILTTLIHPAKAQDALTTYKSLSPELALDLARAALADLADSRSPSRLSIGLA